MLNKPGNKMIPNLIMKGKNIDRRYPSDKKTEKTIMHAQVIFPSVVCQRRIIKSHLIKDNKTQRDP